MTHRNLFGTYIMTKWLYNGLTGRGFKLVCEKCNLPFQVGDCIESKPSRYRRRKMYHKECYESMHLDFGDDPSET